MHGPLARAHVYGNYYDSITYFSIAATNQGQALVQNNYFNNARYPHWRDGGYISASGSSYAGTSTESYQKRDTGDSVLGDVGWYSYSLDSANTIPSLVTGSGGPRILD